jgi:cell division protein FtsQ
MSQRKLARTSQAKVSNKLAEKVWHPDAIKIGLLLVGLMFLTGVVLTGRQLMHDWFEHYPIQKINIVGELKNVDQSVLKSTLSPYIADSFFTVDLQNIKQTAESLAWIDYADAKKEWPNTLVVYLKERTPVANWGNKQFLSVKGEIFSAEHVQPDANLPTFIGRQDQAVAIAERYSKMQEILQEIGLSVSSLELEDRISWKAQLNNGLMLVVDEKDSVEKLKRFTTLYPLFTEQQKQQLFRVDLRYENGLAIKWKKDDGDTNAA